MRLQVANAILPAYVISLLFFIGLLIRVPDIPHYWRWFIWVNPVSSQTPPTTHGNTSAKAYHTLSHPLNCESGQVIEPLLAPEPLCCRYCA